MGEGGAGLGRWVWPEKTGSRGVTPPCLNPALTGPSLLHPTTPALKPRSVYQTAEEVNQQTPRAPLHQAGPAQALFGTLLHTVPAATATPLFLHAFLPLANISGMSRIYRHCSTH